MRRVIGGSNGLPSPAWVQQSLGILLKHFYILVWLHPTTFWVDKYTALKKKMYKCHTLNGLGVHEVAEIEDYYKKISFIADKLNMEFTELLFGKEKQ